jgi:hypothetical protein
MSRTIYVGVTAAVIGIALTASARALWLGGFDSGAVAMQCIDYVAVLGPKDADASNVCREAKERSHTIQWRLLARKDGGPRP